MFTNSATSKTQYLLSLFSEEIRRKTSVEAEINVTKQTNVSIDKVAQPYQLMLSLISLIALLA